MLRAILYFLAIIASGILCSYYLSSIGLILYVNSSNPLLHHDYLRYMRPSAFDTFFASPHFSIVVVLAVFLSIPFRNIAPLSSLIRFQGINAAKTCVAFDDTVIYGFHLYFLIRIASSPNPLRHKAWLTALLPQLISLFRSLTPLFWTSAIPSYVPFCQRYLPSLLYAV